MRLETRCHIMTHLSLDFGTCYFCLQFFVHKCGFTAARQIHALYEQLTSNKLPMFLVMKVDVTHHHNLFQNNSMEVKQLPVPQEVDSPP